jgi:hypothetical protein
MGLSFGFSRRRKKDQSPICDQPLANTFHALFQTVPLQKLFRLFRSIRVAKSCDWFTYKSIPEGWTE